MRREPQDRDQQEQVRDDLEVRRQFSQGDADEACWDGSDHHDQAHGLVHDDRREGGEPE